MGQPLARRLAEAIASKDEQGLRKLVDPRVDFRGMTPGRVWEGAADELVAAVGQWFDESDVIERVEHVETDRFADRERAGYRFLVHNSHGPHLVEQQAYLSGDNDRITWLRIMCSGFRPIG